MAETHSLQELQTPVCSKVFVQRDYSSGTVCRFQTKVPLELENRVEEQQFEETMQTLNSLYSEAETLGVGSYLEGCLSCLTAFTVFLCLDTHYQRVLKKISRFIKDQNEKIYAPRGLLLTDPIERGLRVASFTREIRTRGIQRDQDQRHLETSGPYRPGPERPGPERSREIRTRLIRIRETRTREIQRHPE